MNNTSTQEQNGKPAGKIVARAKKYFSAKHESDDAHRDAQENYETRQLLKKCRADIRTGDAKRRSPREQLGELDRRLGIDKGAKRERAKLLRAIATEFDPVSKTELAESAGQQSSYDTGMYESDTRIDSHKEACQDTACEEYCIALEEQ